MHRLCIILVVIGSVFGQEKQDSLKLKNGNTYNGEFVKIESGNVLFKPEGAFGSQPIKINRIKTLKLSDGTEIIKSGRIKGKAENTFIVSHEKSLTLKKGESRLEIKPGDRVYVRYYKNLPNGNRSLNKLPGSMSSSYSEAKATSYLGIDRTLKVLKTDEERISLSDLYSISPVSNGTMATKYASNCFMVGCSAVTIFFAIASGGNIEFTLVFSAIYGGIVGGVAGLLGLYYGSSYPNIDNEYVIDSNEWVIVENE
jgi:hypothetical protein